jgi:hypothetical protein
MTGGDPVSSSNNRSHDCAAPCLDHAADDRRIRDPTPCGGRRSAALPPSAIESHPRSIAYGDTLRDLPVTLASQHHHDHGDGRIELAET